ncbi:cupin domain-containing protein [Nocardia sp. 2]|uniref:Cupin domain-containing protein n=1 Tax=Nocardia acididurans TaxID=2802282 RepID=A0ABS1MCM6_9NOCA|nr:cupin domain-containing protein [Nocardia acididurans]MBL1078314.1 cupin domain-containing protein [Nocardia acididurans]
MRYEPQTANDYKPEYTVMIRRFTDLLKATGPVHTQLGSAVSYIRPGESIEKHQHPVTEFLYLINGEATVWVEGETQVLTEGDVVVLEPDKLHSVSNTGSEPFRLFSFWWSEGVRQ